MRIRYFVKFTYVDTEEDRRVNASIFLDVKKPVESNEDLYELHENLKHVLVQNKVKNFTKPHIIDFRLEGVNDNVCIPER